MKEHTVTPLGARKSLWGEGPVWWDERLLYVDIEGHRLVRLDPETGVETVWDVGERIGCVVPRTTGGYVYAGDAGINTFNPATGEKANLADPEAAKRPDNRFNDGKCDPAGRFWAGTISTVKKTGDAALYMLETDGTLVTKIHHLTNSNGICWSRDAKTMYHIDTPTKKVLAYDFSLATGEITNPKEVVNTAAAGLDGSPDGMTLDAENRLWIAMCHGACVVRFDPASGEKLRQIDLPCAETTACAFGGPNLDRLFVTTGQNPEKNETEAGRIFAIDGLGVNGLPASGCGF